MITRRLARTFSHAEVAHFVDCVQKDRALLVTGEDGQVALEVFFAAFVSARTGQRVSLPFMAHASKPIDWWKPDNSPHHVGGLGH